MSSTLFTHFAEGEFSEDRRSLVRVGGQTVMAVRRDAMVLLARLLHRIHVDDSRVEVA